MLHAYSRSNFERKLNVSFSFDPATMLCHNCNSQDPHPVVSLGGEEAADIGGGIFFLTDQNFPPILPASGAGCCANIIRVENGTLMEIAEAMVGAVAGNVIKVGSLLVISSASHLAEVGLAGYTEELVRATKFLLNSFENKVSVRLGVPLLLDGSDDPVLIRSLCDLVAWSTEGLRDKKENFLDLSMKAMLVTLKNLGEGHIQKNHAIRHRLPVSLCSFEKKTWTTIGCDDLHNGVKPMDSMNEKFLIEVIVKELNGCFPLNLDPSPSLNRECRKRQSTPDSKLRIITVGASHAARLAAALEAEGVETVHLRLPSWRPTTTSIATAATELAGLIAPGTLTIFQMLDSAAFYARTEDGSMIPARRDPDTNHFHVDGELAVAPKEMFTHTLKICLPLLKTGPGSSKLLLSPLPRYWRAGCCSDMDHVANIVEEGYEEALLTGIDGLRRQCKDFAFMNKLENLRVLHPLLLMSSAPGARSTSREVAEEVLELWGPDPVHPSENCYAALARNIIQELRSVKSGSLATAEQRPTPIKRPAWIQSQQPDGIHASSPWGPPRGGRQRGGRGARGGRYPYRGSAY